MEIPYFKPNLSEECFQEVEKVLRSGWLTTGPKTELFEKNFSKYVNSNYAVMLSSCTAALHVSLAIIGVKEGDEIITSPFTFAATAEVIEYFKAKPIFVDIREDTLNIDETLIEQKITNKTKAIIPVHFAGHPCEMDTILKIAKKYNIEIIEDAAHCTPAYYKNRPIGSISDFTCFSFYANKCITTGEGGMLTSNHKDYIDLALKLRLHGLSKDAANRYGLEGSWSYNIEKLGFKYNPTDISAALGLSQLKKANEFHKIRKNIASLYNEIFEKNEHILTPYVSPTVDPAWHLYPIRINEDLFSRDQVIEILRNKGIQVSVHFIPLHIHSYYQEKYHFSEQDFPKSFNAFQKSISLPIYPTLTNNEVQYIGEALNKAFT